MNRRKAKDHIKVLLEVERDDGTFEVESVWAVPEDHGYRLDNIPFYARGFSWGDVVATTPDPDGLLRCTGIVAISGHSTIRLWFADASDVQHIRDELRAMGCDSELDIPRLVAVDIPPNVPYSEIRACLRVRESAGIFEYEEGCLGQSTHKSEVYELAATAILCRLPMQQRLYVAPPVMAPEGLAAHEGTEPPTVFVGLIPVHAAEAKADPDLFDLAA